MAIVNHLKIFLLHQWRNEVIKLSLVRVFLSVKLIQSLRPFGRIAPTARPYLVMYPLYHIAACALQPNPQRLRHDMLFVQVAFASAIYAPLLRLHTELRMPRLSTCVRKQPPKTPNSLAYSFRRNNLSEIAFDSSEFKFDLSP